MPKKATRTPPRTKVLIPLDGSALGASSIPHLGGLLAPSAVELVLLSVVAPVNPAPLVRLDESRARAVLRERWAKAEQYLGRIRQQVTRRGMRSRTLVRAGDPAAEIVECARQEGVSLIAMSTHGRTGLRRVLLGSVAEGVLRKSPVPVLLARRARA